VRRVEADVLRTALATVTAERRAIENGATPEGALLLYFSVKMRFGGTVTTGNVASPEYVALPGSGKRSDVAPGDAAGRITLVALNAFSAGKTGELGVTGDEVGATCGESTLDSPQPAISNVEPIIARAR
jgi:hypothetical protein